MGRSRSISASVLVLGLFAGGALQAQDRPAGYEPLSIAPDGNGVDLLSGKITFPPPTLSIPANPMLSIGRIHDYDMMLTATLMSAPGGEPGPRTVKIHSRIGESVSESFDCLDGDCTTRSAVKSYMLEGSQAGYFIYRQGGSGKTVIYNLLYATTPAANGTTSSYYASQVKYADGETQDLEYDLVQWPGPSGSTLNVRRVTKVKSNRGYELRVTYISNVFPDVNWGTPATAKVYRRGEYTTALSSITYQSSGQATDQLGKIWLGSFQNTLGVSPSVAIGTYRPPTNTTDQITATSTASDIRGPLLTSLNKGVNIWNYAYSHATSPGASNFGQRDVTVTGPNSFYRKATIIDGALTFPRIISEVDGLNRTMTYTYTGKQVTGITYPEGNTVSLTYDLIGNITQRQQVAKAASGLATIIQQAGYSADSNCPTESYVYCFRPIWVRDGLNNQTDYTWDSVHGGMLTETAPAAPNGIRPQKRIEYTERFAWYKNDAGTYVRSPTGIWLKTRERSCRTTAAAGVSCAGGAADEMVTDYDYGPDTAPNNLLLRGMLATATNANGAFESLRTCISYDALGRKISETKPLANLTSCP